MLAALKSGSFGECPSDVEEYRKKCRVVFPYCEIFVSPEDDVVENGADKHETLTCNGTVEDDACWEHWDVVRRAIIGYLPTFKTIRYFLVPCIIINHTVELGTELT